MHPRPVLEEEGLTSDPHFSLKQVGEMEIKPSADKEMKVRTQDRSQNPNLDDETRSLFYQPAACLTEEKDMTEDTQSRRRGLTDSTEGEGWRVL